MVEAVPVRTLLVILLALPLLQPPGFCVCRLTMFAGRKAETSATIQATRTTQGCRCNNPNCRRHAASPRPVPQDSRPDCPAHCPAHPEYAVSRAPVLDAPAPSIDLVTDLVHAVPMLSMSPSTRPSLDPSPPPPDPGPLYLLDCQFRC